MEQKTRLSGRVVVRTTSRGPALGMQEQDKSLHRNFLHPLQAAERYGALLDRYSERRFRQKQSD
jgi:hypothetical protein